MCSIFESPSLIFESYFLGLYLSDLTYTNVAHPRINGQPTTVWVTKLNTIVDAIAHFQQSRFRK